MRAPAGGTGPTKAARPKPAASCREALGRGGSLRRTCQRCGSRFIPPEINRRGSYRLCSECWTGSLALAPRCGCGCSDIVLLRSHSARAALSLLHPDHHGGSALALAVRRELLAALAHPLVGVAADD